MYRTNVDDLQNRVAGRAEILGVAGKVFRTFSKIVEDEHSLTTN